MRALAAYVGAVTIGIATAVFVLWLGRSTPVGTDISFAAASVVFALAIVAGLLAAALPRHWLALGLALSAPSCVLGLVMFALVARLGEYYWTWLWSALGALAASLLGAGLAAWAKRR